MNICIISPRTFPVPAIKGGAVETLITGFINENEIYQRLKINLVTKYERELIEERKKYRNTNFFEVDFDKNMILKFLDIIDLKHENELIKKIKNKIEKIIYNNNIIKLVKKNNYDFIIVEGGSVLDYKKIYRYMDFNKSVLHIHGIVKGDNFLANNYKYFIGISNFVNQVLSENSIIDKNRIKLLYNGVKTENFDKKLSDNEIIEEKKKYGLNGNEKLIVFCGRTVEEKGVKELILAYKNIYKEYNVKLMIVGNSNFANQVITEYDKELFEISNDIKDNIIFTGHISNENLYKIYNIADIAVFPHLWEEAFGLVFVEAMASGIPLIVTNSGASSEVVSEECAVILEKENKEELIKNISSNIEILLGNDKMRKTMGEAGKERSRKFTMKKYYDNFVKVLEELKEENENWDIDVSKCS